MIEIDISIAHSVKPRSESVPKIPTAICEGVPASNAALVLLQYYQSVAGDDRNIIQHLDTDARRSITVREPMQGAFSLEK